MLDHAHAHHPIKLLGDFAVVAQLNFHVQSATPTLRVTELLPRNCYPDYLATEVARGITGHATPAAADVQQTEAGSQTQPLATKETGLDLREAVSATRPPSAGHRLRLGWRGPLCRAPLRLPGSRDNNFSGAIPLRATLVSRIGRGNSAARLPRSHRAI